jgi:DNA adenine methylase
LLIRAAMGFGNSGATGSSPSSTGFRPNTGFRSNSNRANTTPAHDWRNYPANIPAVVDRLRGVVIENRDAVAVMAQHDSPETLHYCDPPYVHSTRSKGNPHCNKHNYRHEMTDADHQRFAEEVRALSGMVVVSGYRSELYDGLFGRWARVDVGTHADGARDRVESLWLSPTVSARMQPALMEVA